MRSERAGKRGKMVWDWLQWIQEKATEIHTPLVGAKTKDNRERLCREARAYGMGFENHDKQQERLEGEEEQQRENKSREAVKDHQEVQLTATPGELPPLSYKELVFKADYLYEKQAYVLAMKLYEQCWEYAEDEVQQKILLVKLRRCGLAQ